MPPHERELSANILAPALLLACVAVVFAAQFLSFVPLAGATALAAWGGALATGMRRGALLASLVVYVPLVALAMGAQLDAAAQGSLWRQFMAAFDAGAAVGFMVLLIRRA